MIKKKTVTKPVVKKPVAKPVEKKVVPKAVVAPKAVLYPVDPSEGKEHEHF